MEITRQDEPMRLAFGLVEQELRMLFDGTKTYGRQVTPELVATWVSALNHRRITAAELSNAVTHWVANVGGETPTPSDVIAWALGHRVDLVTQAALLRSAQLAREERERAIDEFEMREFGELNPSPELVRARCIEIISGSRAKPMPSIGAPSTKALPVREVASAEEEAERERQKEEFRKYLSRELG